MACRVFKQGMFCSALHWDRVYLSLVCLTICDWVQLFSPTPAPLYPFQRQVPLPRGYNVTKYGEEYVRSRRKDRRHLYYCNKYNDVHTLESTTPCVCIAPPPLHRASRTTLRTPWSHRVETVCVKTTECAV